MLMKIIKETITLFTEKVVTERKTRGNGLVTKTQEYKVYVQV